MLTRLRVSGFKNLVNVDVRFGPFTCIAGANGVGKSNLLDAISFLSALCEKPLIDAALCVRDEGGKTGDVRSLFHRVGDKYADEMSFEAEMIVPEIGEDDLGQPAKATSTFLRYLLVLRYRENSGQRAVGGLEILKEELTHIKRGESNKHLLFPCQEKWKKSVLIGKRGASFISTEQSSKDSPDNKIIKIHQDGKSGRARSLSAINLPRTAISATNAAETPTATLARREMQSWKLLQLEPSSLRSPDLFTAPTKLGSDGSHLAATLYRMGRSESSASSANNAIYAKVANRLSELIEDVRELSIARDENRELLTLFVTGRDGTAHPARALSDGTLRFLALAVLDIDSDTQGVLCLEEPENGIHPKRIPAILDLLQDIVVDTTQSTGSDNPLRQVIINTHSPTVVAQVPEDSLLVAEPLQSSKGGTTYTELSFSSLSGTWRATSGGRTVSRGQVLEYLNPLSVTSAVVEVLPPSIKRTRVMDRSDMQVGSFDFDKEEPLQV